MSRLRALETRRYVLRAANTGTSGFIDPLGNAHQRTEYQTRIAIAQTVYPNDKLTFYTKHGDYLAKIMLGIAVLGIVFGCIGAKRMKVSNRTQVHEFDSRTFHKISQNNKNH
jgi:apolipoprotein N-acyltransferase